MTNVLILVNKGTGTKRSPSPEILKQLEKRLNLENAVSRY